MHLSAFCQSGPFNVFNLGENWRISTSSFNPNVFEKKKKSHLRITRKFSQQIDAVCVEYISSVV